MITTRELIQTLRQANPRAVVDEQRVRAALRWGGVPAPRLFAGRMAWSEADARALAEYLGLELPAEMLKEAKAP